MKPVHLSTLLRWVLLLLALVSAPPTSADPELQVVSPGLGLYQLPADGQTVQPVQVQIANPAASQVYKLKATVTPADAMTVLEPEVYTPGSRVSLFVRPGKKAGPATLQMELLDQAQKPLGAPRTLQFDLTPLPPPPAKSPDLPGLLGSIAAFLLMMLIYSIIAEKITDVLKELWERKWGIPKPTLAELLGNRSLETMLSYSEANLRVLLILLHDTERSKRHGGKNLPMPRNAGDPAAPVPAGEAQIDGNPVLTKEEQLWKTLDQINCRREREARQWVWRWRFVAFWVALLAAGILQIDAISLLKPLLRDEQLFDSFHKCGWFFTGVGASLGASYWHDFLDRLTGAKNAWQPLGGSPVVPVKPGG